MAWRDWSEGITKSGGNDQSRNCGKPIFDIAICVRMIEPLPCVYHVVGIPMCVYASVDDTIYLY